MDTIVYKEEIPASCFAELYSSTGWDREGKKQEARLREAIGKSWYMVAAYAGERLIGCGRVTSDGYVSSCVYYGNDSAA